jgi:hypothetical protein
MKRLTILAICCAVGTALARPPQQPPKTPDITGSVLNGIAGTLEKDVLYIAEAKY